MATLTADSYRAVKMLTESGFSEDQAKAVVDVFETTDMHSMATKEQVEAVKEDIHRLELRIEQLRADLFKWSVPLLMAQITIFAAIVKWL